MIGILCAEHLHLRQARSGFEGIPWGGSPQLPRLGARGPLESSRSV